MARRSSRGSFTPPLRLFRHAVFEPGLLSLIVPTRGRVDGLRRLLDSLRDTAASLESLEFIAVVDEDDCHSREFEYAGLAFRKVVVPPGQTMGNLNLAGYRAARGRYLMLLNDDVVASTPAWDREVRRVVEAYPDGVVLVHVNDLLFGDRLCTFPLLTREFCELAGGICRPEYRRYRIDDHIHHVFDLLHVLGHTRRVYLPDVVFAHHNARERSGVREYVPNPEVHASDTRIFESLIGERRRLALDCLEGIEGSSDSVVRAGRLHLLETFPDSVALRRREHARIWPGGAAARRGAGEALPAASALAPARGAARLWNMLAVLAARLPFVGRLGIGVPPVLVDPGWYRLRYPDSAGVAPLLHYLRYGAALGYDPNPHFHTAWYLANNPDVASAGLNPLVHFVRFGAGEGRDPNLFFDVHYYRRQNLAAAPGVNPLVHFLSIPPSVRPGPNAALTLGGYLERLDPIPSSSRVAVSSPAPLSVVIPTHNRAGRLERTLDLCARYGAGLELEFVVVDDGSTDATPELLRARVARQANLRFHSVPPGGPARARNVGAAEARHPVLLFVGDDIEPAGREFFSTHARRHAENPHDDFAVLGNVSWPDEEPFRSSFLMRRMLEDGSQFAFSRLTPGGFAGWQYFYTSNVSIKKAIVHDWIAAGFDPGFPGAAFEDVEFAYRLRQSGKGLRLCYDPLSLGHHYHVYTVEQFLDRQFFAGRSLRHMIDLHPELLDTYGLRGVDEALRDAGREGLSVSAGERGRSLLDFVAGLERIGRLGVEPLHASLLTALAELRLHQGYVAESAGNRSAAEAFLWKRLFARTGQVNFLSPLS